MSIYLRAVWHARTVHKLHRPAMSVRCTLPATAHRTCHRRSVSALTPRRAT